MRRTPSGTPRTGTNGHGPGNGRSPASRAMARSEAAPTLADVAAPSAFPPIADYGFLSDCEVTALIAPSGNVEWMCLPRMDSPSIFGAILDRAAGGFRLGPADVKVPASRRYLPGTMVLETSWESNGGWIIVRDVLLIGHWHHDLDLSQTFRRPPTDYDAEHVLLRTVRCVQGEVQLVMDCKPVFDYGRKRARWEYGERGYHEGIATGDGVDITLRLNSDMRIGFEGPRAMSRTLLKEGDGRFVALSWSRHEPPVTYDEAYKRLVWTSHHWQHWLARGNFPDHRWRGYLQRSALTLKGLTYANTGAVVAAATTSLPETPQGRRNWDYRYSWIRDSSLTLWGLYCLGFDWEANDYFYFIADIAERDRDLQIVYGVDGEAKLEEQVLDHLDGYEGAKPVRIGNDAYKQRQNDVWGAVIEALYLHATSRDHLDERLWPMLKRQVEQALEHWREPDCGMWEVRGEPRHFTSSKLMCWVAADRGAKLARIREETAAAAEWQAAADEIHADICANGVDERGVFTQYYGTTALDASLLLMPLYGFLPPSDPRIRATVMAIRKELSVDGLIQRYKVEQTDDGLHGEERSFAICSFWMVSALSAISEHSMARLLCEKMLSYASPLELYAEEIDGKSGRHLGNFPQAFTHLALINAVLNVIKAEEEMTQGHRKGAGRLSL